MKRMAEITDVPDSEPTRARTLSFHYPKAAEHRTYHADGFIGTWNAPGNLVFDCYVERRSTPDVIVHSVSEEGTIGEEVEVIGGKGAVRERQCSVVLSAGTALALRDWLSRKLDEGEELGLFQIEAIEEE